MVPSAPSRGAPGIWYVVAYPEEDVMNGGWRTRAVLALVLVMTMLGGVSQLGQRAGAQAATPAGAQAATPVPWAQTWHVLMNNVSPEGENWSFNAFYPDELQAHPGDTIVFTLAPNAQAFHTVQILAGWRTSTEFYQAFAGGFRQPDPTRFDQWQSTYFGVDPRSPCGRVGLDPCLLPFFPQGDFAFGINSGVLVNPPPGGQGNTSFTVTLDPALPPGPYYMLSLVDGPTMSGRINLVAPDQPVQSQEALDVAAERQYQADLVTLAGLDQVTSPPEASNPDGTKTWQVSAGTSAPNKPWLSIDAFAPAQLVVTAGDTVTWTNNSPGAVAHTVSGFATTPDAIPDLNPYQAGCMTSSGDLQLPPSGSFPPDIWNSCVGAEVNNFTESSQPSAPSGDSYVDGPRTSGILLNEEYLNSPIGDGLPYASSYSVTFPNPGTYVYECAIHPGMVGTVIVVPKPMPL
jgi:plastocyanin